MAFGKDTLNLEKQFVFYASYHNNPVNVAIHLICIWPILATSMLFLQYTPSLDVLGDLSHLPMGKYVSLNVAFFVAIIYIVSYLIMDPSAGGLGAVLVLVVYLATSKLVVDGTAFQGYPIWQPALVINVAAWILQFIGHGVFEGRAPALLDSLDQALLTAPLFVLLEVLLFCGYDPDFYKNVQRQVEKNIKEFTAGKNSKKKNEMKSK